MNNFGERYSRLHAKLKIDLLALDEEFMELPMLIQDAAELAAEASEAEGIARHAYDVIEAEVYEKLRQPEMQNGKEKLPSDAQIKALMPLNEDIQTARGDHDSAKKYATLATSLANSLRDKSRALGHVSQLIISGFISPNSAIKQRRDNIAEAKKK